MKIEDKVNKLKKLELEGQILLEQDARTQSTFAEAIHESVKRRLPVKPQKPEGE